MTARLTPDREWWTTAEIAEAGLPDLPTTKRRVNALAERENWRGQPSFARRRAGKGGGWEYHWRLFPSRAQRKLLMAVSAPVAEAQPEQTDRAGQWAWFERLPQAVKDKARARLLVIQRVEAMEPVLGKYLALHCVAKDTGHGARTIQYWFAMIEGVAPHDRLAFIAPRNRAAEPRRKKVTVDPDFMARLKSDYLRPSKPAFSASYRHTAEVFRQQQPGVTIPPERLVRRRYQASTSSFVETLMRDGEDALKARYPAQTRDRSELGALEWVNTDTHKWDVFVEWPLEHGEREPFVGRPQMIAFQDLSSNMILSWRIDRTPNSAAVAAAAGDMISEYGIPQHVLFDNGRENAAKWITGGAKTRYRFRVKDDDIPGLFTGLGCGVHWATPYSGQSKQIERGFRDFAQEYAKHPAFEGAYTGKSTSDKPSNYGERAVPLAVFLDVVNRAMHEWNTRADRRSEVAYGRSYRDVFEEKYAKTIIRKALDEQKRLWLLGAEGIKTNSKTGVIRFRRNEYFAPWMGEHAGERVVIRFDVTNFWAGVHVYDLDGSYLGEAPCKVKSGYADSAEGRAHMKARRDFINIVKKKAKAEVRLTALELGQDLLALPDLRSPAVEAKVVRPVFSKAPEMRAAPPREATAFDREVENVVRATFEPKPAEPDDDAWAAFRRVQEIEARLERGEPVSPDQVRWAEGFKGTAKYKGQRAAWDLFGEAAFASG
ncbi:MAG: Mu transposase C-terminal domain-containing protein [Rhodobacter sp.]|nr:Mu transposase C-terminal domain-containing protein [Rhodobacter sp.]